MKEEGFSAKIGEQGTQATMAAEGFAGLSSGDSSSGDSSLERHVLSAADAVLQGGVQGGAIEGIVVLSLPELLSLASGGGAGGAGAQVAGGAGAQVAGGVRFVRVGDDLVIEAGAKTVVVEGYFAASPPPTLTLGSGGQLSPSLVASFLEQGGDFPQKYALGWLQGKFGMTDDNGGMQVIGKIVSTEGQVWVVRDGLVIRLEAGDIVLEGDIISTGEGAEVFMRFTDKMEFRLGEDARLAIDQYLYDDVSSSGLQVLSIIAGAFSYASGLLAGASPISVRLQTPHGVIGIRGTKILGEVGDEGLVVTVLEGRVALLQEGREVAVLDEPFETLRVDSAAGVAAGATNGGANGDASGDSGIRTEIFSVAEVLQTYDFLDGSEQQLRALGAGERLEDEPIEDAGGNSGSDSGTDAGGDSGGDNGEVAEVALLSGGDETYILAPVAQEERSFVDQQEGGGLAAADLVENLVEDLDAVEVEEEIPVEEIPVDPDPPVEPEPPVDPEPPVTVTYVFDAHGGRDSVTGSGGKIVFVGEKYADATYTFTRPDSSSAAVTLTVKIDDRNFVFAEITTLHIVEFTSDPSSVYDFYTRSGDTDTPILASSLGVVPPRVEGDGSETSPFLATAAAEIIGGSAGADWVSYAGSTALVKVYLGTPAGNKGWAAGDTLTSIQNIIGTAQADTLFGNGEANVLRGNDGIDTLAGRAGNDYLDGGEGGDYLYGNEGNDRLDGGAGNDDLYGGAGDDRLYGGDGWDLLFGGDGWDYLFGGDGDDLLEGGAGEDTLDGGSGDDYTIYDHSSKGVRVDLSLTGKQKDFEANTFGFVANNNDAVGDILSNIEGIEGSSYNDWLTGDDNANLLYGHDGDDRLEGGAGDDTLYGGQGNDVLYGGAGWDFLWGGGGADTLDGGSGDDYTIYDHSSKGVRVDLSLTGKQKDFEANSYDFTANQNEAVGDIISDIPNVSGSNHNDWLTGDGGDNGIYGNRGNDRLEGGAGNDKLDGGDGDDYLGGNAGEDTLDGGEETDTAEYYSSSKGVRVSLLLQGQAQQDFDGTQGFVANNNDAVGDILSNIENIDGSRHNDWLTGDDNANFLYGFFGDDRLEGGAGNDRLEGGAGNDRLYGGAGNDSLNGGEGDDYLGGGTGEDILDGGAGNDYLSGGDGGDTLYGGAGNDKLYGDAGNDIIRGGAGADTYVFRSGDGTDTLTDNGGKIVFYQVTGGSDYGTGTTYAFTRTEGGYSRAVTLTVTKDSNIINTIEFTTYPSSGYTFYTRNGVTYTDTPIAPSSLVVPARTAGDGSESKPFLAKVGDDTFTGSGSNDWLSYEDSDAAGVSVYLDSSSVNKGWANGDTLTSIRNIIGTDKDDILYGNGEANSLRGGAGDDTLGGNAGEDSYVFGSGDGTDTVIDDGGKIVFGGDYAGATYAFSRANEGYSRAVTLTVTKDSNIINTIEFTTYPSSDFTFSTRSGNIDTPITTLPAVPARTAGDGSESKPFLATADPDNFIGSDGADWVSYEEATSKVLVDLKNNPARVDYGAAGDTFSGINNLIGTDQADALHGNGRANTLHGGDGNDLISGGDGADTLYGGRGNDRLVGVGGEDNLYGGAGEDTYTPEVGGGTDTIHDMAGDTMTLQFFGLAYKSADFLEASDKINRDGNNLVITIDKDSTDSITDKITIIDAYDNDPNTGTGNSAFTINIEYGYGTFTPVTTSDFWHNLA